MKIRLNVDTEQMQQKPDSSFMKILRERLCNDASIRTITPEQLMECVGRGQAFTPMTMTGTKGETWQSQQVVCADIDNAVSIKNADGSSSNICLENPLTPERAVRAMEEYGLDPYFMYYSFSSKESWPKFRVVLVLDEPLTDPVLARVLTARFIALFNREEPGCADTAVDDNARIFYGGRAGCVFYQGGWTTSIDSLQKLPLSEKELAAQKISRADPALLRARNDFDWTQTKTRQPNKHRSLRELDNLVEDAKNSFNLSEYIEATTNSRPKKTGNALFYNPCPLCGHYNDFQVTGHLYHCWSASGGTGGTVIDYLMNRDGLSAAGALDKFRYEILNFDREEWKEAYRMQNENTPAQKTEKVTAEAAAPALEPTTTSTTTPTPKNPRPHNTSDYVKDLMADEIAKFKMEVKTGYGNLDHEIRGLYSGLYVLAAISSLGKTTFCLQMADQIAASGKDVVFFSLEQSRLELVSKSIARGTVGRGPRLDFSSAVDSLKIRRGVLPQSVLDSSERYRTTVGERLSIVEGNFSTNVTTIGNYLRDYIKNTGVYPVCFIDYLQILQPAETGRMSAKEAVDATVTQLRMLCRDLNIVMFVVSSVNRANYMLPFAYESLKESGSIEFTADCILGLQLQCLNRDIFQDEKNVTKKRKIVAAEKLKTPRAIELVCLKNRYGRSSFNLYFDYYSDYDLFIPTNELKFENEPGSSTGKKVKTFN